MQCNGLIQLGTDHKTPLQTLVQIELFLIKLKPYFDLPLEKQIWRDSYILNNLRAFQSQEISCWLEELDGNVKHADPCWFSELSVLSGMFVLQYSSQPLRPSWDQQVKKLILLPQKHVFYQTEEFPGTISNIGQITWRYAFWCCQETMVTQCQQTSLCLVLYTVHTNQEHASLVLATCFSPGMSFLPAVYWMAKSTSDHNASDVQEKSGMLEQLSLTRPCLVLPFMSTDSSFQGLELMLPRRSFS